MPKYEHCQRVTVKYHLTSLNKTVTAHSLSHFKLWNKHQQYKLVWFYSTEHSLTTLGYL